MVDDTRDQGGEVDVLFDSRISCSSHVVVSPYFRHLYLVLDGLRLFASGCRCRDRAEGGAGGALAPPLFCKNKNNY